MSGFGFWSHDIGGFEHTAPPAVYKRWIAFGLLSSHSRLHGNSSYRVPWLYDDEAVDVTRRFTQLKCRLMPYLMGLAVTAHETSVPMMRAMVLQYPRDLACRTLDRQYCLGDDLLVAPVFHERRAEYYLPDGEWIHLLTGERRTGGHWFTEDVEFSDVPLWLAPNGVVPMSANLDLVDYDYGKQVRLVLGIPEGNVARAVNIVDTRGKLQCTFTVSHQDATITVKSDPPRNDFEVQVPFAKEVRSLEGGHRVEPTGTEGAIPGVPGGIVIGATSPQLKFTWV
jgi:alpha-D-xyloside xylohydrolase